MGDGGLREEVGVWSGVEGEGAREDDPDFIDGGLEFGGFGGGEAANEAEFERRSIGGEVEAIAVGALKFAEVLGGEVCERLALPILIAGPEHCRTHEDGAALADGGVGAEAFRAGSAGVVDELGGLGVVDAGDGWADGSRNSPVWLVEEEPGGSFNGMSGVVVGIATGRGAGRVEPDGDEAVEVSGVAEEVASCRAIEAGGGGVSVVADAGDGVGSGEIGV